MYMKSIDKTKIMIMLSPFLLLQACSQKKISPAQGGYYYNGIYFGSHFTMHYKDGIEQGCITAKGSYKKDHWLFKHSKDYKTGWFLGRNRCRHLRKIDENGDLVL